MWGKASDIWTRTFATQTFSLGPKTERKPRHKIKHKFHFGSTDHDVLLAPKEEHHRF